MNNKGYFEIIGDAIEGVARGIGTILGAGIILLLYIGVPLTIIYLIIEWVL